MSGLLENTTRIHTSSSTFNLLQYFVLIDKYEENLTAHGPIVEKAEFHEIPKIVLDMAEVLRHHFWAAGLNCLEFPYLRDLQKVLPKA